jgi:hypothetical protein
MELAMVGKKEETIVKLFLYIVGSQGREIHETLSFDQEPEERSFKDIVEAFSNYCDPKKNETVERYKFFTRVQEAVPWFQRFIFIICIAKGRGNINLWLKAAIDSSSRANQFELGSDPDSVS